MQEITAQVLKVEGKKSKNGQSTYYDVSLSDGNDWRTFDANLANTAAALAAIPGQVVTAHGEVVQRGQYTNYDLHAIGPQGSLAALPVVAGTPVVGTVPVQNGAVATPNIPMVPNTNGRGPEFSRGAALNSAIAFIASGAADTRDGEDANELLARYTRAFEAYASTGTFPWEAATPESVAAAVPGVQVGVEPAPEVPAQPAGVSW